MRFSNKARAAAGDGGGNAVKGTAGEPPCGVQARLTAASMSTPLAAMERRKASSPGRISCAAGGCQAGGCQASGNGEAVGVGAGLDSATTPGVLSGVGVGEPRPSTAAATAADAAVVAAAARTMAAAACTAAAFAAASAAASCASFSSLASLSASLGA